MQKIVLASTNKGKSAEIRQLLVELPFELVSQAEFNIGEIAETGMTFVENAIIKARQVATLSGLPALADDSGLVVDSLLGAPGVYSARYAGEGATDHERIAKLLREMVGKIGDERRASFHSVVVLMRYAQDPAPLVCHGIWQGSILQSAKGEHGFGYDPVFFVPTHHCSAAELDIVEKNRISHRGRALAEFKAKWAAQGLAVHHKILSGND